MFSDDSSGKTCHRKPSKIHALFLLIVTVCCFVVVVVVVVVFRKNTRMILFTVLFSKKKIQINDKIRI